MKKIGKKIAPWVIGVALVAYIAIMAFMPKVIGAARQPVSYSGTVVVLFATLAVIIFLLTALLPGTKKLRGLLLGAVLVATALTLSTNPVDHYYYTPTGEWKEVNFQWNYPGRGGKYGYAPEPYHFKLEDKTTSITVAPVKGKEIEILNEIGEKGTEGFPDYVNYRVNFFSLQAFETSWFRSNLPKICTATIVTKLPKSTGALQNSP